MASGLKQVPTASWSERDTKPPDIAAALSRLAAKRDGDRRLACAPARALNLVTVVERARRDELLERLERLGRGHPTRLIVCVVDEHDRSGLDATATMDYEPPEHPGALGVYRERVEIELGLGHVPELESILDQLLVRDVPTVVWSPHQHQALDELLHEAQVVLIDSGDEPEAGAALARAARLTEDAEVVDLAWLRTTPWRERLAAAFDPLDQRGTLRRIDAVTVYHEPAAAASGLLLTGWLCSRLGWEGGERFRSAPNGVMSARTRARAGHVALRLQPAGGQSAPGLAGVTVSGPTSSLSLDRGPGGLTARRRTADGPERRWTMLGASRGEPGILADAMRGALARDLAYRPALCAAADMLA